MEMIVLIFVNVIQEDTPFNIINHLQFYISAIIGPFSACVCQCEWADAGGENDISAASIK